MEGGLLLKDRRWQVALTMHKLGTIRREIFVARRVMSQSSNYVNSGNKQQSEPYCIIPADAL